MIYELFFLQSTISTIYDFMHLLWSTIRSFYNLQHQLSVMSCIFCYLCFLWFVIPICNLLLPCIAICKLPHSWYAKSTIWKLWLTNLLINPKLLLLHISFTHINIVCINNVTSKNILLVHYIVIIPPSGDVTDVKGHVKVMR